MLRSESERSVGVYSRLCIMDGQLVILFAASAFHKLSSIYVFKYLVISLLVLRAGNGI